MTYVVNLQPRDRATLPEGREWGRPNALGDIARTLIGEGADPEAKLVALRNGRPMLEASIDTFAGRMWAGAESDPKFRTWRPHPHTKMPPRLVAWATENGFLHPDRHPPTAGTLTAVRDATAQGSEGRE